MAKEKYPYAIIEDDLNFAHILKEMLDSRDEYMCCGLFDSAEGFISALENDLLPAFIFLDIELKGMTGIKALPLIKYLSMDCKIIVLTQFDDDDYVFHAIKEGANAYILKSSAFTDYLNLISQVLDNGFVLDPKLASHIIKHFFLIQKSESQKYGLTKREREILKLFVELNDKNRISDSLYISPLTLDTHIKNIYSKLRVHSQMELAKKVFKENLI